MFGNFIARFGVGFALLALSVMQPVYAADKAVRADASITVEDVWSPPSTSSVSGVAYGVIKNNGTKDDALIGLSAALIAETPEIHTHDFSEDVFRMRKLDSLELPAGSEKHFEPGALHFMLIGLAQPLKDGDAYQMTLHFKHHADVAVNVSVSKARLIAYLKSRNTASQHHH